MTQAPQRIESSEKYCYECGTVIRARAEICPNCGVRQPPLPGAQPASSHNKVVAALLAILLGTFGIHKFYLGKIGWGLLYLLLCWTAIPTIVGFIEGIIYLSMSEASFARKYG